MTRTRFFRILGGLFFFGWWVCMVIYTMTHPGLDAMTSVVWAMALLSPLFFVGTMLGLEHKQKSQDQAWEIERLKEKSKHMRAQLKAKNVISLHVTDN